MGGAGQGAPVGSEDIDASPEGGSGALRTQGWWQLSEVLNASLWLRCGEGVETREGSEGMVVGSGGILELFGVKVGEESAG